MAAGVAFVYRLLRSLPSTCDQHFPARVSFVRRGYCLTVATPITSLQTGGQKAVLTSAAEQHSPIQRARSSGMGNSATAGSSWPRPRVVKVDGRSTEVFEMQSSAGEPSPSSRGVL